MRIDRFDYELPPEMIAQRPLERRGDSRLLVYHRADDQIVHGCFADLPETIPENAVLVLNNTRVIPARLWGTKEGGGARIEVLLLEDLGESRWKVIANRAKRLRKGSVVLFDEGIGARVEEVLSDGQFVFRFDVDPARFTEYLEKSGETPLPPYIKRDRPEEPDRERYQTVYAKDRGSSAAPTAGLHFDEKMLDALRGCGVGIVEVTLHVGLDTWKPVTAENVEDHPIHSEYCAVTPEAAERLNAARRENRPILAVGTTSVRTLESAAGEDGTVRPFDGRTRLFITPGYRFRVVDMLLTNFHLPRSTLLLLVASFIGEDRWRRVYEEAVKMKYRFYSYGDAMLIL